MDDDEDESAYRFEDGTLHVVGHEPGCECGGCEALPVDAGARVAVLSEL
jgi:hypothetical protein